jgi:hypothetical protein
VGDGVELNRDRAEQRCRADDVFDSPLLSQNDRQRLDNPGIGITGPREGGAEAVGVAARRCDDGVRDPGIDGFPHGERNPEDSGQQFGVKRGEAVVPAVPATDHTFEAVISR